MKFLCEFEYFIIAFIDIKNSDVVKVIQCMALHAHINVYTVTEWQKFLANELPREKTGLRGFRPGVTQISLYIHRGRLQALNFGYK